jgi:hypothetical protein
MLGGVAAAHIAKVVEEAIALLTSDQVGSHGYIEIAFRKDEPNILDTSMGCTKRVFVYLPTGVVGLVFDVLADIVYFQSDNNLGLPCTNQQSLGTEMR